jgi:hypothetical protein
MYLKGADDGITSRPSTSKHHSNGIEEFNDTQTGIPSYFKRGCHMRSKIRWFTEFCNSHYISQFAAFFIDARTKRSIVESCIICFTCFNFTGVCKNIGSERGHLLLQEQRLFLISAYRMCTGG